jgi:hypothetical protein
MEIDRPMKTIKVFCLLLASFYASILMAADADPIQDLEMQAEDFECIQNWDKINNFFITNKLGHLEEALEVANSVEGGEYPVGTIIQLVPIEAMVKRAKGWDPQTNDWEFFFLGVDGHETTIITRGAKETMNRFGGNCFDCHSQAEPQWDMVCQEDRGCEPLPWLLMLNLSFFQSDSRCEE